MFVLMRRDIRLLLDDGVGSIRSRGQLRVARRLGHRPEPNDLEELISQGTGEPRPGRPRLHARIETRGEGEGGRSEDRPPSLRSGPSLKGPDLRALTSAAATGRPAGPGWPARACSCRPAEGSGP